MGGGPDRLATEAQALRGAGLCVLPARREGDRKRVALRAWKPFQQRLPTEAEVRGWFAASADAGRALCLVCGAVSGNLEMIDFDAGGELFQAWCGLVRESAPDLPERLVFESTPSGGRHAVYRCQTPVCGNLKLAQRRLVTAGPEPVTVAGKTFIPRRDAGGAWSVLLTLIETRGEGGLFLCAPSAGYGLLQGDLARPPVLTAAERDVLLEAAWSLTEHVADLVDAPAGPPDSCRPGDEFNVRGDVRPVLTAYGWTLVRAGENEHWCRPGKTAGTSATLRDGVFYVFSSNGAPFESNKGYSPFAVYALLEHDGDYGRAAAALRAEGFGGAPAADGVDISALLPAQPAGDRRAGATADPGPIPDELLRIPGFVSEVMDHCLDTAPYPNLVMAFCGGVSLQAFLAGRKVRDPGDNRTNLYLLGLAHSAGGKDWPRKLNTRILYEIGLAHCLGDRFASGEGLQDALFVNPCMLFQTDEIDGMLQSINKARDARHESIMGTMLTIYSSSNSVFPMRRKAGRESPGAIDQPHLVVFGTAIPNHYYDALSERMLTNGLFARNIVFESGPRSKGRDPRIADLPQHVLDTARWWADLRPGTGNLERWHPVPVVVEHAPEARAALAEAREIADAEYAKAEHASDAVGTTVWGRVVEHVRKLALVYAVSENARAPVIGKAAVEWAGRLVMHQTRRSLHMVGGHVADTPFDAECLKLLRKLREAPERCLPHSVLLKRMKMDAKSFLDLIRTLEERGEVSAQVVPSAGRHGRVYRLVGVNEDGEGERGRGNEADRGGKQGEPR